MKNSLLVLVLVVLFAACTDYVPSQPYVYESNPHYSHGFAFFYGSYYADHANPNNVLEMAFFTDSLYVNDKNELAGVGQYLLLDNVFIPSTDTLLQPGVYHVDNSGNAFTIFAGKNDTINGEILSSGAQIFYYEKKESKSKSKLITSGTVQVESNQFVYTITCNLQTSDKKELKGYFSAPLPHYDKTLQEAIKSGIVFYKH